MADADVLKSQTNALLAQFAAPRNYECRDVEDAGRGPNVAGSQAFRGHLAGRSVVNVWATKNHAPAAIAPPQMTFYPIGRIPKGARFL
jgi:hypothetical protein